MSKERIETLLRRADDFAGPPATARITAAQIRRRVYRRQVIRITVPLTAAAGVAVTIAVLAVSMRAQKPVPEPRQIASLEEQVRQLQVRTDATLKLVQEVLERDRRQRRLATLEAEIASIPDPVRQVEQQVDKTVFVLLYQADRLYKELNQTESAVAAYEEIIRLFPKNRWAEVARERLAEIDRHRSVQPGLRPEPRAFIALQGTSGERGNSNESRVSPPVPHKASNALFRPMTGLRQRTSYGATGHLSGGPFSSCKLAIQIDS